MRKLMSIVTLKRIYPSISIYIPENQRGFMRERSTSDIMWIYKWIETLSYQIAQEYHILGIDMSKAFDSIDRRILLEECIQHIVPHDEYRIIRFLLSDTKLSLKVNNEMGPQFETINGTPQGDALSPVLFIIYLEYALKKFRAANPNLYQPKNEPYRLFTDIAYADDVDIVCDNQIDMMQAQLMLSEILPTVNLQINQDKTEHTTIKPSKQKLSVKKLGGYIDPDKDVQHKITRAALAFTALSKLWREKIIKIANKAKLVNTYIVPILTYNAGVMNYSQTNLEQLNRYHRRLLRRALNIYYPKRITNSKLYEETETQPLSHHIVKLRWSYIRKVLRKPKSGMYLIMLRYFITHAQYKNQRKGRKPTNILSAIQSDLKNTPYKLRQTTDLETLREKAHNTEQWKTLETTILAEQVRRWNHKQEKQQHQRIQKRTRNPNTVQQPSNKMARTNPTENSNNIITEATEEEEAEIAEETINQPPMEISY